MSARKDIPFTQDELFEMFRLDLEKGELYWKPRHRRYFTSDHRFKIWNKTWAYNKAGTRKCKTTPMVRINGNQYMINRLIWKMITGKLNIEDDVIHLNKNDKDNRWMNLKCVTINENRHRSTYDTKSGFTGVFWRKDIKRWQVSISINHKKIDIGSYKDFEEAKKARIDAENKYWHGGGENV